MTLTWLQRMLGHRGECMGHWWGLSLLLLLFIHLHPLHWLSLSSYCERWANGSRNRSDLQLNNQATFYPNISISVLPFCSSGIFWRQYNFLSLRQSLSRLPNMANFYQSHGNFSDLHLEVTSFVFLWMIYS